MQAIGFIVLHRGGALPTCSNHGWTRIVVGLALDNSGTDCIHRQLYTTGWIYRGNGWSHGRMALGVVAGWSTFLWWSNLCYRLRRNVFVLRMAILQEKSVTCHKGRFRGLIYH